MTTYHIEAGAVLPGADLAAEQRHTFMYACGVAGAVSAMHNTPVHMELLKAANQQADPVVRDALTDAAAELHVAATDG